MTPTYSAGGECDAWCTKCKRDSLHNIIAVDPSTRLPARVECRSCHGAHRYSPPRSGPKPAAAVKKRAASTASAAKPAKAATPQTSRVIEQRWDDLVARFSDVKERPYNVKEHYQTGDAVMHSKFGLGFVVDMTGDKKIQVLFRDAERTLITGHGS